MVLFGDYYLLIAYDGHVTSRRSEARFTQEPFTSGVAARKSGLTVGCRCSRGSSEQESNEGIKTQQTIQVYSPPSQYFLGCISKQF